MNRIYRTVFNRALGLWQAAPETARGRGKGGDRRAGAGKSALAAGLALLLAPTAWAGQCNWSDTAAGNDWFDLDNWIDIVDCPVIPTAADNVYISSSGDEVTIDGGDAESAFMELSSGRLTIQNGGSLNVSGDGNRLVLGLDASGSSNARGTLVLGARAGEAPLAPGFANVDEIEMGRGTTASGRIVFNHTDTSGDYTFAPDIAGKGRVEHYAGTTALTGNNDYSGDLLVEGGTLALTGDNRVRLFTLRDGTLRVDGGALHQQPFVNGESNYIGREAGDDAALVVANGGSLTTGDWTIVGYNSGARGSLAVTGEGSSADLHALVLGQGGEGRLLVEAGGRVTTSHPWSTYVGGGNENTSGSGFLSVTGAGSVADIGERLSIAEYGDGATGFVTLAEGGELRAGSGVDMGLGNNTGTARLAIGADSSDPADAVGAGLLDAPEIRFRSDIASVSFNHTDTDYQFDTPMVSRDAGVGTINHYAGTTLLTGDNSGFSGNTSVFGGTLQVEGTLGGAVTVEDGGALGGSGSVGATRVADGGTLAPGSSIGTLAVDGDLTLARGALLDFEFGPPGADFDTPGDSDSVTVTGDMALNGATLDVTDTGDMGPGLYRLFDYDGVLTQTNGGLVLGNNTDGLVLQYLDGAGQINLLNDTNLVLNFWNANGQASEDQLGGGDGTWSNTSAVWTDADGTVTGAMQPRPGFAIFGGEAGRVTLDDTDGGIQATGLQFVSDGYVLEGDALTLVADDDHPAPVTIRVGDGGAGSGNNTATINSDITGTDGLRKAGAGTLVLGGDNAYTGGTTVEAGTLIGDTGSLRGDIANAGTVVFEQAGDAAFAGDVTGLGETDGAMIKRGDGDLTLNGVSSLDWSVDGGGLITSAGRFTGDIAIGNGASVTFDEANDTHYSGDLTGQGHLIKEGAGTLTLTGKQTIDRLYIGGDALPWDDRKDGGTLELSDGAQLQGSYLHLTGTNSRGVLALAGEETSATFSVNALIGDIDSNAELRISDGATLVNDDAYLGHSPGSQATALVTGTGSLWRSNGDLSVGGSGQAGDGTLRIEKGGRVESGVTWIGAGGTGSITVTGADSTLETQGELEVGRTGQGSLLIDDGATVLSHIAMGNTVTGRVGGYPYTLDEEVAGSAATIRDGGSWHNDGRVVIGGGQNTSGTLTLADGGRLRTGVNNASLSQVRLADDIGSRGTLNIGAGLDTPAARAGVLESAEVRFGPGNGTLVFNHTDTGYEFDAALVSTAPDSGQLRHRAGETLLTGDGDAFTGTTTVSGGTLRVNGALGGTVTVRDGGTLGGNGTLGGTVVENGAVLAPGNSLGHLTVDGDLTVQQGATLDFEFGAPGADFNTLGASDSVTVHGDLAFHGVTLTPADAGGFGAGLYRLFEYDGELTQSNGGLSLADGTEALSLRFQEDTKRIDLFNTAGMTLNVWHGDGGDAGDGVWSRDAAVWTDIDGQAVGAMQPQPGFALFQGDGGIVTLNNVDGAVEATGLQFAADGYALEGDRLALVEGDGEIRVGDGGGTSHAYTATIASVIAGTEGMTKTGDGTLVLTGDNTYTGGTTLNGGTLEIDRDANLGEAAGDLTFNGGTLNVTGRFTSDRSITLAGDGTLHVDTGALARPQLTLTGVLTGAGGLIKTGEDSLALSNGDNDYTGGTLVEAGAVSATASGALGTGPVTVQGDDSYLYLNGEGVGAGSLRYTSRQGGDMRLINGANGGDGEFIIADEDSRMLVGGQGSTAANARIHNQGDLLFYEGGGAGQARIDNHGVLRFGIGSSAGQARIVNEADGQVRFFDRDNDAGNATLINKEGGVVDISGSSTGLTLGALSGDGEVHLGGRTLTLGSLGLDTTLGGTISNQGTNAGSGGGLVKTGSGTLTLEGDNTYTGATAVEAGQLVVNGSLAGTSLVSVHDGARLGGDGTVGDTTVASGGTLAPGNSVGTLTVDGDLVFENGSFYDVEVSPDNTDSDLVHVTGSATLAGSVLHVGNDGDYQPFTEYTILSADGGILGEFEAVRSHFAFLDAGLDYGPNDVQLALTRNNIAFDSVALTRNQGAVAGAVETLPADHAVYQDVVTQENDAAPATFDRYSGDGLIAGLTAADRLIGQFGERLRQRNQAGHLPGDPRTLVGDAGNGLWLSTGAYDGKERRHDLTGNAAFDISGEQLTLGLDRTLPHGRVGIATGRAQGRLDFDRRADEGELEGWFLGAYGHHDITESVYARADLSYGEIDHDHERRFETGARARSDSTVKAMRVALETGLTLNAGRTGVRPYAQVAMTRLERDGFRESGAGDASLDLADTTLRRGEAALGVKLGQRFQRARLHADLAAIQPFGDTESAQTARFSDAGDTFTVYGADRDDPRLRGRFGGAVELAPGLDLSLDYQVRADDQGNEQLGELGVSWRW